MEPLVYRVLLTDQNSDAATISGLDSYLGVSINDYKECYVMVERILAISSNLNVPFIHLNFKGLVNVCEVIVSGDRAGNYNTGYVGTYRGQVQHVIGEDKMIFDYESTENWMKVSLSSITSMTYAFNSLVGVGIPSQYYMILKFKFAK